uniref:CCHC-type domain-containing protein n=1 Tax=Anopheles stephensi TaxID=30069 RepID=A0A182Y5N1_ANOST
MAEQLVTLKSQVEECRKSTQMTLEKVAAGELFTTAPTEEEREQPNQQQQPKKPNQQQSKKAKQRQPISPKQQEHPKSQPEQEGQESSSNSVNPDPTSGVPLTKGEKRRGRKRPPTTAIRVCPATGRTYSEVVESIRIPEVISALAASASKRRAGDSLLIKFRRLVDIQAIVSCLRAAAGDVGTVRVWTPMTTMVCSNLDTLISAEELRAALQKQHSVAVDPDHILLQPSRKRALVRLAVRDAMRLKNKSLRVGLVTVPLQEQERRPLANDERCFRCMERGHRSSQCGGVDRTGCCFRCGSSGHKAFACQAAPKCLRCGGHHQTGSPSCGGVPQAIEVVSAPDLAGVN